MPGIKIVPTSSSNTSGLGKEGVDFTASLRVHMDSGEDTGWNVIEYIRGEGWEFGTEYNVGNTSINDTYLYQVDPPELVEGSCWMWDVVLHYSPSPRKAGKGAKGVTQLKPSISIGTVAKQTTITKALYRGGFNGPGYSARGAVTSGPNGIDVTVTHPTPFEDEGADGSFSRCVGLIKIDDAWGRVSAFDEGSLYAPPIQNSANIPYSSQTKQKSNGLVTISRNVPGAVVTAKSFPVDWVNSRACLIFSRTLAIPVLPYTMKLIRWLMTEEEDKQTNAEYIKITGEFELQPEGWRYKLLDAGRERKRRAKIDNSTLNCDWVKYFDTQTVDGETKKVAELTPITEASLGGKCFDLQTLTEEGKNTPIKTPLPFNGNGQELGYTQKELLTDKDGLQVPLDCDKHMAQESVWSVWSVYDEIDALSLPFFRGIIRPL